VTPTRPHPSRPQRRAARAAAIVSAAGGLVAFCGLAIAYGTVFSELPHVLRLTTPVLFPLAAFAAAVVLGRRRQPAWQAEIAGYTGLVSTLVAWAVITNEAGWLDTRVGAMGSLAAWAVVGALVSAGVAAAIGHLRLGAAGVGVMTSLLGVSLAVLAGIENAHAIAWVVLAEAAVAGAVAVVARRTRVCRYGLWWAMTGVWVAATIGVAAAGLDSLSVWHAVLGGAVLAALVGAPTIDAKPVTWTAAAAGVEWLCLIAVVVGSATSAALAVIVTGVGLAGLGIAIGRIAARPGRTPSLR
jgi:hypothetical protein